MRGDGRNNGYGIGLLMNEKEINMTNEVKKEKDVDMNNEVKK